MLIAGTTSSCDVCLDSFSANKVPCSISCGHVFCVQCLEHISPPTCPMCRKAFDPRFNVKLVLDLDNVKAPPSPSGTGTKDADQDARRLYQEISNIAEAGCSESKVRQLISDGKSFLHKQPRDSFKDLRTLYRIIAYLCEVKTNLRAQKSANDAIKQEQAQLQAEKNELIRKIEHQLRSQEEERQQALAIELSLREHCSKAHEAYETMVQQYNYVANEWKRMNDEIKRLREIPRDPISSSSPYAGPEARFSPHELNQASLNGAAIHNEGSILISPLPQFTTRFNTTMTLSKPLPDLDEEDEEEEEEEEEEEGSEEEEEESDESEPEPYQKVYLKQQYDTKTLPALAHCNLKGHPYGCRCTAVTPHSDDLANVKHVVASSSRERLDTVRQETVIQDERPFHIPNPSGLSRTAPYADVRRARSHSIPSQSSGRSSSSSRPSSRSCSPARPQVAPSRPVAHRSAASYDSTAPSTTAYVSSPPPRTADNDGLRSRLHNILADTSSSPPKHSTSASMTIRDQRATYDTPRRSASRSVSPPPSSGLHRQSCQVRHQPQQQQQQQHQQQQQSTTDQFSRLLASHQTASPSIVPSTSPGARTSSASDAARALEQSKRGRRHSAEQAQRYPDREGERTRTSTQTMAPHRDASAPVSSAVPTMNSHTRVSASQHVSPSKTASHQANGHREQYQQQQIPYQSRQHNGGSSNASMLFSSAPGVYA